MKKTVFCTTRFEGFHCWPEAPNEVAFLRDRHRHEFRVRAEVTVDHADRDVEFILLKRKLDKKIDTILEDENTANWSCEMWAITLIDELDLDACEVSEDGENGAYVEV